MLALPQLASAAGWSMATTPRYQIFSQLDDNQTRAWMRDFDQFVLSTSDILSINPRTLPPLTVVLFKREADYTPYKLLRPNGQVASVAGQFARRANWGVIGMARDADSEELERIIHHEATHWLLSGDGRQPAWFTEGIAEMLSTFERRGDKVNWAKPINSHLQTLYQIGTLKLAEFLEESSAIFDDDRHTGKFYAQSWAFTHFLMFSDEQRRRPLLLQFLREFKSNSGEATVAKVFGSNLPAIEKDFRYYITQRLYHYISVPVKPAPEPPLLQNAPASKVEVALGYLALGAARTDQARTHAERANTLDPASPGGHELLAYLALGKGDPDEASTHAEAAVQRSSTDSEQYMILGHSYRNGHNSDKANAERMRLNLYEKAINLNPLRRSSYMSLADALMNVDAPREEDAKFLAVGLRAFPGDDWMKLGAAVVDYRLGRKDVAREAMDGILRAEGTLKEDERSYAMRIRTSWLIDDLNRELEEARGKRDTKAGRQVVARYRELLADEKDAQQFLDKVDANLAVQELLARREEARRAGRRTEVRQVTDELLKLPDLPADLRSALERDQRGK